MKDKLKWLFAYIVSFTISMVAVCVTISAVNVVCFVMGMIATSSSVIAWVYSLYRLGKECE